MPKSDLTPHSQNQVNGLDFTLAFRTILGRERICAGHSINAWATHSCVDPRSLSRFVYQGRSIQCGYAWRLCTSLGLDFPGMVRQSIELAYRIGPGGRPSWKGTAQQGRKPSLHRVSSCESAAFTEALALRFAAAIKESGLSLTAIAQGSGLSRPSLSRLGQSGRDNHSLSYLFDLTRAIGHPLDLLAREAAHASNLLIPALP